MSNNPSTVPLATREALVLKLLSEISYVSNALHGQRFKQFRKTWFKRLVFKLFGVGFIDDSHSVQITQRLDMLTAFEKILRTHRDTQYCYMSDLEVERCLNAIEQLNSSAKK